MDKILIIEQDKKDSALLKEFITEKGYFVVTSNNGENALRLLDSTYSLILIDVNLPKLDGISFLKMLKNGYYKDLPVIMINDSLNIETEIECFNLGAIDFIYKPFNESIVSIRIENVLQLSRLQRNYKNEIRDKLKEINKKNKEQQDMMFGILESLSCAIDFKDRYTNGHSKRVAKYSKMLAIELGLSPDKQEEIYIMGYLHDIGKIGVNDTIINKESSLSDLEFENIKEHTTKGWEILKHVPQLKKAAEAARWHHERWDGLGYPDGLKGEKVPFEVRIVKMADSYDAMASNRSYRKALPQYKIIEEINKNKGTQFDPQIADAMLRIIVRDKKYYLHE